MTIDSTGCGSPNFLIVPGLNNSCSAHWQTLWQRLLRGATRAELGDWARPQRDEWVARLDHAIRAMAPPVVLCAHSLGCHAVAWWAMQRARADGWPVAAALLVAPPDCDTSEALAHLPGFSPAPLAKLPFPSIVAGSRDDQYATIGQTQRMAREWGSTFVDTGTIGHINAESGIGCWPAGLALLGRLLRIAGFDRSVPRQAAGSKLMAA